MKKQAKKIDEGMRKQGYEVDLRLSRLEQVMLDINAKLSKQN
jgi:hypothetical protein